MVHASEVGQVLNTILFLMGLVIALGTFFAVIFMADEHPVVEEFKVTQIENEWKAGTKYKSGDYVSMDEKFYQANIDHTSDNWTKESWNEVSRNSSPDFLENYQFS